ncbi:MAG: PAS domain S-box protein [Dissulfurispiraceae bacterium]
MTSEDEIKRLISQNEELRKKYQASVRYIRDKVDQLLTVMGTSPLKPEELDDETLISVDPIGIVSNSFVRILKHLHRTNEKMKLANDEIKAIFESTGMGILVIDRDMRVLEYNTMLREYFFEGTSSMIGQSCRKLICQFEDLKNCPFVKIFKTGKSVHLEKWLLHDRYYDVVGTPVIHNDSEINTAVIVYMDITDRIRAEEELRESEEKYRDLFENANDIIQCIRPDGSFLYVNRAWSETLGYGTEQVSKLTIFDIIHPECIDCGSDFKTVVFGQKPGRIETKFITQDRKEIIVEGNINNIIEKDRFVGTRGIFRDITERKKAEDALASEKERLLVTLRSIGDGVITTDLPGTIVLINKVAEKLTGWSQQEAVGRPIMEVFNIIDEKTRLQAGNPVYRAMKSGQTVELENHTILVARDGAEIVIADSVAPIMDRRSEIIGAVLVFRDITEKKDMELRLLKAEKIESLGVLAGGIAHDFNNLLNGILGNIDLALTVPDLKDEVNIMLSRAEKATLMAIDLTNQLLTFSKGGAPIKKTASISELIMCSTDFVLRGASVRCESFFSPDLWQVEIDEGQISQVINNLVINAVQAMPDGGLIHVSAENVIVGHTRMQGLNEGGYVKITIRDEGVGISSGNISKIFEPYFTTKQTGAGLGLATAYSIMRNHNGLIDVESHVGAGTTFYLYLPALEGKVEPRKGPHITGLLETGKGKILVMDDDPIVRQTVGDMLKHLGYDVVFAAEGRDAIEIYKKALESGHRLDAVIMDLTVPGGMGGKEAIGKLLEIDPGVRAIVSSGYSNDPVMANHAQYGFAGVVAKPCRLKSLGEVIKKVISKA